MSAAAADLTRSDIQSPAPRRYQWLLAQSPEPGALHCRNQVLLGPNL